MNRLIKYLPSHSTSLTIAQLFEAGRISHQKLTKRLLFSLPDGAYLISGVGRAPGIHSFAGKIDRDRGQTWSRIVAAGASGRMFWICRDQEAFNLQMLQFASIQALSTGANN